MGIRVFCFHIIIASLCVAGFAEHVFAVNLHFEGGNRKTQVFYSEGSSKGWSAVMMGKVISIGSREDAHKKELFRVAQDRSKITVRLYKREGIKEGDELFVVNKRNLVVGRINVKVVFQSYSFGPMLVGYGNYKAVNIGDNVVRRAEEEYSQYAFIYTARGRYFEQNGDPGRAIEHYKKAIQHDRGNPEAHLALGLVYLKDNMIPYAFKEFSEAYQRINRLYDREDKYTLLKSLVETRYRQVYEYSAPSTLRKRYIDDGIRYAGEALELYPDSREVNLYLGMFYYKNPDADDVKAKNQFLKVIELDAMNTDAYVALAELYRKHNNSVKARFYAEKALKVDPYHQRARQIINLTD
ncbi:MAG TPA: tetratricopeptide repeat protein [Spirochaetota bacterium]|nr:tetratricopeptide repeat protein [Spirochaetota bacterium]